jgi:hypothetical protein
VIERPEFGARDVLVDRLAAAMTAVERDLRPQVHVLLGPPGSGKSWIVQQLFRRLSERRDPGAYWPMRLGADEDPVAGRHALNPVVESSRGRPTWLWWGIRCGELPGGVRTQAVFSARTDLLPHLGRLRPDVAKFMADSIEFLDAGLVVLGLVGLAGGPAGTAVSVAAIGVLLFRQRRLPDRILAARSWRRRTGRSDRDRIEKEQVEDIVAELVRASRRAPAAVVIDDGHWADETVARFVAQVRDLRSAPVLLVVCTWPTASSPDRSALPAWLEELSARGLLDAVHDLVLDVPLRHDELAAIVADEIVRAGPGISQPDTATIDELCQCAAGNPLAARMLVRSARTIELLRAGRLDPVTARTLKGDLSEVLGEYWRSLPERVQRALALASTVGESFPVGPVVATLDRNGLGPATLDLDSADRMYVLDRPTHLLRRFTERLFLESAQRLATTTIPDLLLEEVAADVAVLAGDPTLHRSDPEVWIAALAAHAQFGLEGRTDRMAALRSCVQLGELLADRNAFRSALETTDRAHDLDDGSDPVLALRLRRARAGWLEEAGRGRDAVEAARSLVAWADADPRLDADDRASARIRLGSALLRTAAFSEARACLVVVTEDPAVGLRTRLAAGERAAEAEARAGRYAEAEARLRSLAALARSATPPDPARERALRLSAVKIRMRSGAGEGAIEQLATIRDEEVLATGPTSPEAVRAGLLLVEGLMALRSGEAEAESLALLRAARRDLADDDPRRLKVETRFLEVQRELGRHDVVVRDSRLLTARAESALGRRNANTLRIRGLIVDGLIGQGELGAAEQEARALIADLNDALGPRDPDSLTTRRRMARILLETGRCTEVLSELADLLLLTVDVRGPEHRATRATEALLREAEARCDQDPDRSRGMMADPNT